MIIANDLSLVGILLHTGRDRRWLHALAEQLEKSLDRPVALRTLDSRAPALPFERLDRLVHGAPRPDHSAWFATDKLPPARAADLSGHLLIDTGDGRRAEEFVSAGAAVLTPTIEGRTGESGLLAALAVGDLPHVALTLTQGSTSRTLLETRLAIPFRHSVPHFLNTLFARLITLIDAAVRHLLLARPLPLTEPAVRPRSGAARLRPTAAGKAKALARTLAHRVAGHVVRTADWTIGIRRAGDRLARPAPADLAFLPCGYDRFAADPILFEHDGVTALFFEDYSYSTDLGKLSCVIVQPDGRLGEPMEVMKRSTHLSYPFVFAHEGQAYMVPETSAERRVELWRATRFPDRWEQCATLLEDLDAVDATLKRDEASGRWWMFLSVAEPGGSTFDTLSLYSSDELTSGWRAHPLNPVKLDPSSSRPAGPIRMEGGSWLRPAQDCTRGYGSGLAWCRISDLSEHSFAEEVVDRWHPPSGYRGLHTFTSEGGWEAIDLQRRRWRWSRP